MKEFTKNMTTLHESHDFRNVLLIFIFFIIFLFSGLLFGEYYTNTYLLKDYTISDKVVTYTGEEHILTFDGELNGANVIYENNVQTESGEYLVKATFDINGNIKTSEALLTIEQQCASELILKFDDNYNRYSGLPHSFTFNDDELPNDVTYSYLYPNSYIEIGTHKNVLIISSNNPNIKDCKIDITYTVLPPNFTNISFKSKTFIFDGQEKSIEIEGELPFGYTVDYTNNYQSEIGMYIVTANFYDARGVKSDLYLTTTLKIIEDQSFNNEVFNSEFDNHNFNYDGSNKEVKLKNHYELINLGYDIEYIKSDNINSGVHSVKAIIKHGGTVIRVVDGTFEINKQILNPSFIGKTIYDYEEEINLVIDSNSINEFVSIDYRYYDLNFNQIDYPTKSGTYIKKAYFTLSNNNFIIQDIQVVFTINKSFDNLLLNDSYIEEDSFTYNGLEHSLLVSNHNELISNGFDIKYFYNNAQNNPINSGEYIVEVNITKGDLSKTLFSKLTINKKLLEVSFNEYDFIKQGSYYDFYIEDSLVEDIYVFYKYYNIYDEQIAKPSVIGSYYVVAEFINFNNNYIINDILKEFEISLDDYNQNMINEVTLVDTYHNYDGTQKRVYVSNYEKLKEERYIVQYSYNGSYIVPSEIGEYNVEVSIIKNGILVKNLSAKLYIL